MSIFYKPDINTILVEGVNWVERLEEAISKAEKESSSMKDDAAFIIATADAIDRKTKECSNFATNFRRMFTEGSDKELQNSKV